MKECRPIFFDAERVRWRRTRRAMEISGALLTLLHRATIESENHGRNFLQILEKEMEPAIKELSTVLLYSDKSITELDDCVKKFETAMHSIRSAQRSLQSSLEQVRASGEKLIKS